jgi:hypothetical protein
VDYRHMGPGWVSKHWLLGHYRVIYVSFLPNLNFTLEYNICHNKHNILLLLLFLVPNVNLTLEY